MRVHWTPEEHAEQTAKYNELLAFRPRVYDARTAKATREFEAKRAERLARAIEEHQATQRHEMRVFFFAGLLLAGYLIYLAAVNNSDVRATLVIAGIFASVAMVCLKGWVWKLIPLFVVVFALQALWRW
jgi:predicted RND superfamily exporter protein